MKVLVTGAHGFVGKHVVKELDSLGHDLLTPSSQELDLLNAEYYGLLPLTRGMHGRYHTHINAIRQYLADHKVDAIVHLAATCGGIGINADNPGKFIYENLQMGINVLEAARLAGVSKVVNLGTVCAYPKYTPTPFQESDIWNGYPEETNAPYGIAKKTIMEMGIAYSRQYNMDVTNLVPVNMAGEWDNFDEYSSHVIPALIKKFESPFVNVDVSNGPPYPVTRGPFVHLWGTGSASREFLYAGDCARAIGIALEKNTGPDPINLGTGQEITIRQLAELTKRVGGYDAEIIWDSTKPDGQPRRCLDVTRAKNVLRWEATTSLEELLRRTISWYRDNV
jgi:GDP-L-fucose synthase